MDVTYPHAIVGQYVVEAWGGMSQVVYWIIFG